MDLNALAFLKAVLPDGGWYAAWTKVGERKYNTFFSSIEELAQHILTEDAQGKTVYHACASFKEQGSRKQENAWGAKSLWLDIDANKPDSPYATAVEAARAVFQFVRQSNLPPPLFVGSGYGVHCYWPLAENIGPDDWLELAAGLKGSARHFGLHADPSRTTDLASVLRTPGTYNRKSGNTILVECGQLVGPYAVELFDRLIPYGAGVDRPAVGPSASGQVNISPLTQALIVEPDYAPVYADEIANQCAQVNALRASAGNIPEPLWYAALGVLSRCVDGEQKAHEWSSGYQGYTEAETQNKYDRTLALTGATTCAKFESINYAGCQGCPFKGRITSPISLGSNRQGTAQASGAQAGIQQGDNPLRTPDPIPELPLLPNLPPPFEWTATSQLVCVTEKNNAAPVTVTISQYPVYLASVGIGEVHSDRFSYHFRQWLPHRGWFNIYIAAGKLFGPGGIAEIAERGATIHDPKLFLNYARAAADQFHAREKLKMTYDQCGWKGFDKFLVGDALYTAEGVQENVTVNQELHTRAQWLGPQNGTLDGWSGAANALFAVGCEAQSFALACAFAAPLMRLQATDEGGAVVNLLSRGSGTGKTTALSAVYTAWGKKQGLSLTKIDTRVSKAITLGVLGNLPIVYDELGNRDPMVIREFIDMFTSGRDKMRGNADGSIQHTQASWQTLMVSGSNQSIHDILTHAGGSDALAYRVLEFHCQLPAGVVAAKGDQLRKDMEANAGWAGDEYINYLMQPGVMGWVQENLTRYTAEMWARCGNRPEHRFWMRTIGAVAVASTIVNNIHILQFNPARIVEWALNNLMKQLDTRHVTGLQKSIGTLADFLSQNTDTVLVMRKAFQQGSRSKELPVTTPRRAINIRFDLDTRRLLIADKPFRDFLMKQEVGANELLMDLESASIVRERRRFMTLTAGTDIAGAQQTCIEVDGNHPAISGTLAALDATILPTIRQDNAPAGARV